MPDESLIAPLSSIHVDKKLNCRTEYELDDLRESLKTEGLLTPLTVQKDKDGNLHLVSGFTRFEALKQNRVKEVPVVVKTPETVKDTLFINLAENLIRNPVHDADLARRFAQMESGEIFAEDGGDHKSKAVSREEIAKRTKLSKTHIGNLIRCDRQLIPSAKRAWRKYDQATRFMFSIAPLTSDEQEVELEKFIALRTREKEEGKKRRGNTKEEEVEGEEGEEGSGGNGRATLTQIKRMLGVLANDVETGKVKGMDKAFTEGKVMALQFVLGDVGPRKTQSNTYVR